MATKTFKEEKGLLQKTIQARGVPAPITPGAAETLTGNADVAKMVGTPAQKQKALETPSLETVIRRQGPAGEIGERDILEGAAKAEKATQLEGLQTSTDRAQQLVQAKLVEGAAQAIPTVRRVNTTAVETLFPVTGENKQKRDNALNILASDPKNQQALADLNQALGRDRNSLLTPVELEPVFLGTGAQAGQQLAENVQDTITVMDLVGQEDFGYTLEGLATLLGVDPTVLASFTTTQLADQIRKVQATEFAAPTAGVNLSSAERGLATQQQAAQSIGGGTVAQAQVDRLVTSVQSLGNVEFNGTVYPIEELLASDTLSKEIEKIANLTPEDPALEAFKKANPKLAKFIEDNKEAIKAMSLQLAEGAATLTATQKAIQEAKAGLSDETLLAFGIDVSKISAEGPESFLLNTPLMGYLNSLPAANKTMAVNNLNNLKIQASTDPVIAAALGDLKSRSLEELTKLGLGDSGKVDDPSTPLGKWIQSTRYNADIKRLAKDKSPEGINKFLEKVFGNIAATEESVTNLLEQDTVARLSGDKPILTDGARRIIDANNDNIIDSPEEILSRATLTVPGIQGMATGASIPSIPTQGSFKAATPLEDKRRLKLESDGKPGISPEEVFAAGFTDEEILKDETLFKKILGESFVPVKQGIQGRQFESLIKKTSDDITQNLPTNDTEAFSSYIEAKLAELSSLIGGLDQEQQKRYGAQLEEVRNQRERVKNTKEMNRLTKAMSPELDKFSNSAPGSAERNDSYAWLTDFVGQNPKVLENKEFKDKVTQVETQRQTDKLRDKISQLQRDGVSINAEGRLDMRRLDARYLGKIYADLKTNYFVSNMPGIGIDRAANDEYNRVLADVAYWLGKKGVRVG
jgi:hypothetical protein